MKIYGKMKQVKKREDSKLQRGPGWSMCNYCDHPVNRLHTPPKYDGQNIKTHIRARKITPNNSEHPHPSSKPTTPVVGLIPKRTSSSGLCLAFMNNIAVARVLPDHNMLLCLPLPRDEQMTVATPRACKSIEKFRSS